MPSAPKQTAPVNSMDAADILNGVRNYNGGQYADMVPQALKPGDTNEDGKVITNAQSMESLRAIGSVLVGNPTIADQFLNTLTNRIATVIISSRLYRNPWRGFKKGTLEYGEVIEEIFVAMADPQWYKPDDETSPFKTAKPNIFVSYHVMNYQMIYETTVNSRQLKQAFLSWRGVNELLTRIIEQVYTGANYDEFIMMKYMIARLALDGKIATYTIDDLDSTNARGVTTEMVTAAGNFGFMSNQYNEIGVTTYTDPSYLWTILTNKARAIFDVEVLAISYNMDKADLIGRQIMVDSFTIWDNKRLMQLLGSDPWMTYVPFTDAEIAKLDTIIGLMVDEKWFMIFDNLITMSDIFNPRTLDYNYFYHAWKTFSISPTANALLFTSLESTITGVTLTSTATSLVRGGQTQLTPTVTGTGFVNTGVTYSVSGATDPTTDISLTGLLTVGKNETATQLTATATSKVDATKSASVQLTVAS